MTGKEILEAEFEKSGMRGYRADQVDALLQSIASYVDKQNAEIKDLKYKTQILADKIEEYKKDEESIRDALLGAQKMGSSILNEAKAKAETVLRESKSTSEQLLTTAKSKSESMLHEAKVTSEDMLAHAKLKIESITKDSLQKANEEIALARKASEKEQKLLDAMKLEVSNFRSYILKQYKEHLDLLSNLPTVEDNPVTTTSINRSSASTTENIKVEEIKDDETASNSSVEENDDEISITNAQTIKTDIKLSTEADHIQLANEDKQQTREFPKRNFVSPEENETEKKPESTNSTDKFVVRGQRPSFAEKYGELDFGNHKDK